MGIESIEVYLNNAFENKPTLQTIYFENIEVKNMDNAFKGCTSLTHSPSFQLLGTSPAGYGELHSMVSTFEGCTSLEQVYLSEYYVYKGYSDEGFSPFLPITNMDSMFKGCSSLTEIDMSGIYPNECLITNCRDTFLGCSNDLHISGTYVLAKYFVEHADECGLPTNLRTFGTDNWELDSCVYGTTVESEQTFGFRNGGSLWEYMITDGERRYFKGDHGYNVYILSDHQNVKTFELIMGQEHTCEHLIGLCAGCTNMTTATIYANVKDEITDTRWMFKDCTSLQDLYLLNIKLASEMENISEMFLNCPDTMRIHTTESLKQFMIANAEEIALPTPLRDANSNQWIIV